MTDTIFTIHNITIFIIVLSLLSLRGRMRRQRYERMLGAVQDAVTSSNAYHRATMKRLDEIQFPEQNAHAKARLDVLVEWVEANADRELPPAGIVVDDPRLDSDLVVYNGLTQFAVWDHQNGQSKDSARCIWNSILAESELAEAKMPNPTN